MEALSAQAQPYVLLLVSSVALLFLHVFLQGGIATLDRGLAWNAGPRDQEKKAGGVLAGRAERCSANFRETYPAFVGLVLAAMIVPASGLAVAGGWLWFAARVIYIPLYLAGVPYVRSIVWLVSLAGLAAMALSLVW